jgi:hypothetical protein
MSLSRRHFLRAPVSNRGTALVGGLAAAGARAGNIATPGAPQPYPFHGPEAGRRCHAATAVLRLRGVRRDRTALTSMLRALTERARFPHRRRHPAGPCTVQSATEGPQAVD